MTIDNTEGFFCVSILMHNHYMVHFFTQVSLYVLWTMHILAPGFVDNLLSYCNLYADQLVLLVIMV